VKRIWRLLVLPGSVGLAVGLSFDARAGDDDTVPSQVAKAGPGGVALNIHGDQNVVNISPSDPQVKAIVNRLMATSVRIQKRQRGQDESLAELGRQMEDVQLTVASLVAFSRQPHSDQASQQAVNLLAAGETDAARNVLKEEERAAVQAAAQQGANDPAGSAQRKRAAILAMDQGALASLTDTQAAIAAYERASQYEPDNPWTLYKLGDVQLTGGRTADALGTFEKAKKVAETSRSPKARPSTYEHEMAAASIRIGDAKAAQGDNSGALERYRDGLRISEPYADASPDMTGLLRARAALYQRVGDALVLKRDYAGASVEYERSVAVRKRLLDYRPDDTVSAVGLSSTYQKFGDLRAKQLDYLRAISAYEDARQVTQKSSDPNSTFARSNEAKILQRIGSAQLAQKETVKAHRSFNEALSIWTSLVVQDPSNFEWEQNLALTYVKLGDLNIAGRNYDQAVSAYQRALSISIDLANHDGTNLDLQRRLAICQRKVGFALNLDGNNKGALDALRNAVQTGERLVQRDSSNAEWRTDLALAYWRLGTIREGQRIEDRSAALHRSDDIFMQLKTKGELARDDEQYASAVSREVAQLPR
jgi:tetratricopeptide (TPR) repeat protein